MERRAFGKTGMNLSVLGFGGSEIGWLGTDPSNVERLLNEALDAGLNIIDTAECYVDSETKIGNAVSHRRQDFFLFTKCGHAFQGASELAEWSPELLRASLENSLKCLRTDAVDLLQLHSCSREVLQRDEIRKFLEEVRTSGKARFIGYSGDGQDAAYALEMSIFDSLQTSVNIADQESIDLLLPRAKELGMGVIAKRPVANVAWINGTNPPDRPYGRTYWERLQALDYPFLKASFSEGFETALRFTLSQSLTTMIVGTTQPGRWTSNADIVAKGNLSAGEIAQIRQRWSEIAPRDWIGQT